MRTGFTLLEVVVALLLLEVAVLAASGTLVVASRALRDAEEIERAVLATEGVLDSLAEVSPVTDGSRAFGGGAVAWTVATDGLIVVRASRVAGDVVLQITSAPALP